MWWKYAQAALKEAVSKLPSDKGLSTNDIAAIGISYQMHGLVCVDKDQKVLRPAIIWCDSRAVPYGEEAYRALGEDYCRTHYLNSPGNFTAAKLAWVKANEPELYARIDKIMLPGDYIAMRLTGEAVTTVSGLSEGILAVDEKGGILHENAAAWTLLGGEDTEAYKAVMNALRQEREDDQWDEKFTAGDRVLYFAVSRLPSESKLPRSRGTVALIRDITEQERLERTRHDYVANISHELRTPLASIRGLGEGLRDGLVTDEKDQQRYYNIIVEEVTRLSRLVNDLLELSSLQSNPAAFEMERVDPNELIYDLHDRNSSLFSKKQITFVRDLPEEPLPDIRSNEDRLAQVLTIFLDNARKFTPEGGTVTLGAEKTDAGTRFFVRDTGIGMDEETQRLAFDRFHQAERSHGGKGSGLGLSIAKEVLQKMGVEITLKSALGEGSEFSFTIP